MKSYAVQGGKEATTCHLSPADWPLHLFSKDDRSIYGNADGAKLLVLVAAQPCVRTGVHYGRIRTRFLPRV